MKSQPASWETETPVTRAQSALSRLASENGGLTLGLSLPLESDWSPAGEAARREAGRRRGVPGLERHLERAQLADRLGFAALWVRDVPLYDPTFGDAGSVFDPWAYLGALAQATRQVVLGTAAVVLPLRHPLHAAKAAASVDRLSGGRLALGIASGDRPSEFPVFGADYEGRGESVREAVRAMRAAWSDGSGSASVRTASGEPAEGLDVLPKPAQKRLPLIMAGYGQQTPNGSFRASTAGLTTRARWTRRLRSSKSGAA